MDHCYFALSSSDPEDESIRHNRKKKSRKSMSKKGTTIHVRRRRRSESSCMTSSGGDEPSSRILNELKSDTNNSNDDNMVEPKCTTKDKPTPCSPKCVSSANSFEVLLKSELTYPEIDDTHHFWCCLDVCTPLSTRKRERRKPRKEKGRHRINDDTSTSTHVSNPAIEISITKNSKKRTTSMSNTGNMGDSSDVDAESSLYTNLMSQDWLQKKNEENEQRQCDVTEDLYQVPWLDQKNNEACNFNEDEEMSFSESIFGESRQGSTSSLERGAEMILSEHTIDRIRLETSVLFDRDDTSSQGSILSFDPDDFQEDTSVEDNEERASLSTIIEEDNEIGTQKSVSSGEKSIEKPISNGRTWDNEVDL